MDTVLANVRVVLVSPLYGGNLGSVCRAMSNMGLSDLVVASPREDFDMAEARKMACHAGHILSSMQTAPDLKSAVSDCVRIAGTTARRGLYRQHAGTARELAPRLLSYAVNARVAIVFGREDNGLTNDELLLCTDLIQIPTTTEYSSLNLAQAVLICAYELFLSRDVYEPPSEKAAVASSALRERMLDIWREALLLIEFMDEDKADHMMQGVRRVMSRGALTEDDVNIMLGVARQAMWAAERASRGELR